MTSRQRVALLQLSCACVAACIPETAPNVHATHLGFLSQPVSARSTESLGTVSVAFLDSANDIITSATGTVELALTGGDSAATLLHASRASAVNGIARFQGLAVDKAASEYRLVARAEGLDSALSASFAVKPGIAGALMFSADRMSDQIAGAAMSGVRLRVTDLAGNLDATSSVLVTLSLLQPAGGTPARLVGATTRAAVAGVAQFDDVSIQKAGTDYALIVTAEGLRPDTSAVFSVLPGPINSLRFLNPMPAAKVGRLIPFGVYLCDEFGNWPVGADPQALITLAIDNNPTGAELTGRLSELTNRAWADFDSVYVNKAGSLYTLIATSPGYKSATSTPFTVSP